MNLTPNIERAIKAAARLHAGQTRKTTNDDGEETPYVAHVYVVAWILAEYTDNEDVIIAGLLHDVLEHIDPAVYDEPRMRAEFGDRVTDIVLEVSEDKDGTLTQAEAEVTWKQRKLDYLTGLKKDSQEGLLVCAADKLHNTHGLVTGYKREGEKMWEAFNAGKEEKLWYYNEVLNILKARLDSSLVVELEKEIQKLKDLI